MITDNDETSTDTTFPDPNDEPEETLYEVEEITELDFDDDPEETLSSRLQKTLDDETLMTVSQLREIVDGFTSQLDKAISGSKDELAQHLETHPAMVSMLFDKAAESLSKHLKKSQEKIALVTNTAINGLERSVTSVNPPPPPPLVGGVEIMAPPPPPLLSEAVVSPVAVAVKENNTFGMLSVFFLVSLILAGTGAAFHVQLLFQQKFHLDQQIEERMLDAEAIEEAIRFLQSKKDQLEEDTK